MNIDLNRRQLLGALGAAWLGAGRVGRANAQHEMHDMNMGSPAGDDARIPAPSAPASRSYRPVQTLNGWTLPYRLRDGVKEFHLVAEQVEHDFAPGCVAKCWGYNGSSPSRSAARRVGQECVSPIRPRRPPSFSKKKQYTNLLN